MGRIAFDTCFLIDAQRELVRNEWGPARLFARSRPTDRFCISTVVLGEFTEGFPNPEDPEILSVCEFFDLLPVTAPIAQSYGILSRKLRLTGTRIGTNDLWIAATCLVSKLALVTRNQKHFGRIEGLQIIDYQV